MRRLIVTCLCLMLFSGVAQANEKICKAQASWIKTPSLPDFSKEPVGLCPFNQLAWQSFFYLVQPVEAEGAKKVLRFQTYESLADLFPEAKSASACAKDPKRPFLPRVGKSRDGRVPSILQAGSNGVLVDQDANVTLFQQYFDPTFSSFVRVCDLATKGCETVDPTLTVPVGSLQLKASWRPIQREDPNYARFYTLKDIAYDDPQTGKCVTRDVALVGLHVVYAPAKHPELVWATFEHIANAPDGPCTGKAAKPPAGFKSWTYNNAKATDCTKANDWPYNADNPPPVPYPVTQTVRNWPYGTNATALFGAENIRYIETLNASVASLLPADSVWKNYFLVGSVWTAKGILPAVQPTQDDEGNLVGSILLSNATMETFTQAANPLDSNGGASCFSCHNTTTNNPQPVHVVHALTNAKAGECSWTKETMPAACKATQGATIAAVASH